MKIPFMAKFLQNEVLSPQKAAPKAAEPQAQAKDGFEQTKSADPGVYKGFTLQSDVKSGEGFSLGCNSGDGGRDFGCYQTPDDTTSGEGFSLGCNSGDGGRDFGCYNEKDDTTSGQAGSVAATPKPSADAGAGGWIVSDR
jgi:hypothetical protein